MRKVFFLPTTRQCFPHRLLLSFPPFGVSGFMQFGVKLPPYDAARQRMFPLFLDPRLRQRLTLLSSPFPGLRVPSPLSSSKSLMFLDGELVRRDWFRWSDVWIWFKSLVKFC